MVAIIIAYVLIVALFIWLIVITVITTPNIQENIDDMSYDTLYHLSGNDVHPVQFTKSIVNTSSADIISLSNIIKTTDKSMGYAYLDGTIKTYKTGEWLSLGVNTNVNNTPINGYGGMINSDNMYSFNILKFNGLKDVVFLEGNRGNTAYIKKLKRMSDGTDLNYIQVFQEFNSNGGYESQITYQGIYEMLSYIKKNYPEPFVLIGDFNVHGHQKISEMVFGSKDYHIGDMVNTITCNNTEALVSPDGFVVSKKLYPRIEWEVEPVKTTSWSNYALVLKMYRGGYPGSYDTSTKLFKNYIENLNSWRNSLNTSQNYYKKAINLPSQDIINTWNTNGIKVSALTVETILPPMVLKLTT